MRDVKRIMELGDQLSHLLEQDSSVDSEERTAHLKRSLAGYKERYNAHINSLQQCQITDFFRQRPQPGLPALPHDPQPSGMQQTHDASDFSDSDFSGFDPDEVLDQLEERGGTSGGGGD